MSPREPRFEELVGDVPEGPERERLRRVHDLLVAAGPPPEYEHTVALPRVDEPVALTARRKRPVLVAIAAAFGLLAFALGYVVADGRPVVDREIAMSGVGSAAGAQATIDVFALDSAGNWPMEISVDGLEPAPAGKLYQLWLTRDGELAALCGSFLAEPDGTTVVPMNAPWRLDRFDGWVVVVEGSEAPLLST